MIRLSALLSPDRDGRRVLLLLILAPLFLACGEKRERVDRGLYEWRSMPSYTAADQQAFDSLGITRLFIHFFDVQWGKNEGHPIPQSVFAPATPLPKGVEVVPTIYIVNEVLKKVERLEHTLDIADRIVGKLREMAEQLKIGVKEVQLDCDWTASTKTIYFDLINAVKEKMPGITISATIRLHQVKYRGETGVPPADRGILMVYNVGSVTDVSEGNSIFDQDEVEAYLGRLDDYPLPLDVALPVFSWGVRFHYERFAAIIDNVTSLDMEEHPDFRKVGPNHWQALRPTELRGSTIFPGDIVRIEESPIDGVSDVAERIASDLDEKELSVLLYRYSTSFLDRHDRDRLLQLYHLFE